MNNIEQQAKELVDKYLNAPFICKGCDMPFCDIKCTILTLNEAKQCAVICCQYIISANPHSNPLNTDVYSTMEHWKQVKNYIENNL